MSRITTKTLTALLLAFLGSCQVIASAQSVPAKIKNSATGAISNSSALAPHDVAATDDYIIGSDDVLAINVWKEPDLSRTVPVRPDGKITLPLLGDVPAEGLTPGELEKSVQDKLSPLVRD